MQAAGLGPRTALHTRSTVCTQPRFREQADEQGGEFGGPSKKCPAVNGHTPGCGNLQYREQGASDVDFIIVCSTVMLKTQLAELRWVAAKVRHEIMHSTERCSLAERSENNKAGSTLLPVSPAAGPGAPNNPGGSGARSLGTLTHCVTLGTGQKPPRVSAPAGCEGELKMLTSQESGELCPSNV